MSAPLIEFPADDPERARRFWSGVLGADLEPRPGDTGAGWEINRADLRLGVHQRGPGPGDIASLPYFAVPDLPATLERVQDLGGSRKSRFSRPTRAKTPSNPPPACGGEQDSISFSISASRPEARSPD